MAISEGTPHNFARGVHETLSGVLMVGSNIAKVFSTNGKNQVQENETGVRYKGDSTGDSIPKYPRTRRRQREIGSMCFWANVTTVGRGSSGGN